ncbi:uncharacterized protein TRUGW13939_11741 [Talaromyces rugulosus]|uniref:Nucleoside phosphorylase domain-containing protein n=1 Tax=Talaromyces rugulosus TaxID=121627 RepID=A0A7H8RE74_TALRU|nr:uncharacterized protein TRUGW13939_11741 [Talaromyces rugulosus]QKX64566.1 hypothetical protein TRUGW13939_11741 [Talaromyces rugulosus]
METSFNYWVYKTKALSGTYSCLDDRLEDYSDAKDSIIDLLEVLAISLQYFNGKGNYDETEEHATWAIDFSVRELHFMWDRIDQHFNRPDKYTLSIRPNTDDDYYKQYASTLVRNLFPNARQYLRDQLATSLVIRRIRFIQTARRFKKKYLGHNPFQALLENDEYSAHLYSMAYPEMPKIFKRHDFCVCPYCSELLGTGILKGDKMYWKNHIDGDTKPYVCLSECCTYPLVFFSNMKEWIDHMENSHSPQWNRKVHTHTWDCDTGHDTVLQFTERESFRKHMMDPASHPGRKPPTEDELEMLFLGWQKWPAREDEFCCPICECVPDFLKPLISKNDPNTKKGLYEHIAWHLKDLAFKFIPRFDCPELKTEPSETDDEEKDHLRAEGSDASYPSGFDESLREAPLTFDENPIREEHCDVRETADTYFDDIGFNDFQRLGNAQVRHLPGAILEPSSQTQQSKLRPKSNDDFAVAILCESYIVFEAVYTFFDEIYDDPGKVSDEEQGDLDSLLKGRIGNNNVLLYYQGEDDTAEQFISDSLPDYPEIQLVLIVGTCGGAPYPPGDNEIFLGDVIVSNNMIRYHHDYNPSRRPFENFPKSSIPEVRTLLNSLNETEDLELFNGQISRYRYQLQQSEIKWRHPGLEDELFGNDRKQIIRRRDSSEKARVTAHIGKVMPIEITSKSAEYRDKLTQEYGVIGFINKSEKTCHPQGRLRHWMLPSRNTRFVGRSDELKNLEEWVMQRNGPCRAILDGPDGIGKTQIALELAHRIRDKHPEFSIFWISCTTSDYIQRSYRQIARSIEIKRLHPGLGIEQVQIQFHQRAYGKWLFILDGCDDIEVFNTAMFSAQLQFEPSTEFQRHLEPFPPFHGLRGRCLVTSRNQKLSIPLQSFHKVTVLKPDPETGIKILETLLRKKRLPIDRGAAITLLGEIDVLPSAITQAAAYMNRHGCGISDYIKVLASRGARRRVELPSN